LKRRRAASRAPGVPAPASMARLSAVRAPAESPSASRASAAMNQRRARPASHWTIPASRSASDAAAGWAPVRVRAFTAARHPHSRRSASGTAACRRATAAVSPAAAAASAPRSRTQSATKGCRSATRSTASARLPAVPSTPARSARRSSVAAATAASSTAAGGVSAGGGGAGSGSAGSVGAGAGAGGSAAGGWQPRRRSAQSAAGTIGFIGSKSSTGNAWSGGAGPCKKRCTGSVTLVSRRPLSGSLPEAQCRRCTERGENLPALH
jgi:hypothetical protein